MECTGFQGDDPDASDCVSEWNIIMIMLDYDKGASV